VSLLNKARDVAIEGCISAFHPSPPLLFFPELWFWLATVVTMSRFLTKVVFTVGQ